MEMLLLLLFVFNALGGGFAASGVFLRFYDGKSLEEFTDVASDDFDRLHEYLQGRPRRNRTVIYSHGFGESLGRKSAKLMAEGNPEDTAVSLNFTRMYFKVFLLRQEDNFLAFAYLEDPIPVGEAVAKVPQDAEHLSRAVTSLLKRKTYVHLVGYSLGAYVMAQVGKILSEQDVLVPRITGLDPAGNIVPVALSLRPDYAQMVDVIHTDAGAFGFAPPCGTVDFFPNVGTSSQPGCCEEEGLVKVENLTQYLKDSFEASPTEVPTLSLCSHERSWRLFAETVLRPESFLATKKFGRSGCRAAGDIRAYVGLATPPTATGCYFVDTDAKCPFGGRDSDLSREELATLCGGP